MNSTKTKSRTNTHTKTRAKELMRKRVAPDIQSLATRGFITRDKASKWACDLSYLAEEDAIEYFDMCFSHESERMGGYRYTFICNKTVTTDELSGGLNLWNLPSNVSVEIVVRLRSNLAPHIWSYLSRKGWVGGGELLSGDSSRDRTFSYQGYGVTRQNFGGL